MESGRPRSNGAADGFVKLLQMMVLPYITMSIISLGSLRPAETRVLGLRAAAVIGGLWIVALAFAFLISLTFPSVQNASFFSSSLVERRPTFDFINLYIPANPFNALANNVVPAVVLFSLVVGVALAGIEHRERLIEILQVMKDDLEGHQPRHSPDSVRALCDRGQRAGTLGVEELNRLQVYPRCVCRGGAVGEPVGAPGARGGPDAHSPQGHTWRVAGFAHHRLHRRRPLHRYSKAEVLASMQLLHDPVTVTVARAPSPPLAESLPPLEAIGARQVLRVGYLPDALPFAFFNQRGDLVGFDVELAHRLAREMGVGLAFVPVDRDRLPAQLAEGYCDLVMSGVVVTTPWAREVLFSDSYLDETLALVVPDHDRDQYTTLDAIRARGRLTIAVPDVPYYIQKLRDMLPAADLRVVKDVEPLFEAVASQVDAIALPAERGSAWTLRYPAYSVVVPGPDPIRVPLAFPISRHDEAFASFVNTWIALKRKDGTIDTAYKYWILGQNAAPRRSRWSIVRDVLHWME